ncbi:hypothetical protein D3C72_1869780 [compost metagenome]
MEVAARGLAIQRRDDRAIRHLELRIGIGLGTHCHSIDKELGRVTLQAQYVLCLARCDHLRGHRQRGSEPGAVHGDLAGALHRHLHVRDEDVAPLRALVRPGRAAGVDGVDLVLGNARVLQRAPRGFGG